MMEWDCTSKICKSVREIEREKQKKRNKKNYSKWHSFIDDKFYTHSPNIGFNVVASIITQDYRQPNECCIVSIAYWDGMKWLNSNMQPFLSSDWKDKQNNSCIGPQEEITHWLDSEDIGPLLWELLTNTDSWLGLPLEDKDE